jgi:hypothetical protein
VQEQHHKDLRNASISPVLASGSKGLMPAVCRPSTPAQRAAGLADAALILDANRWEAATQAEKLTIQDHGLSTVEGVFRGDGPAMDAEGRPGSSGIRPTWLASAMPRSSSGTMLDHSALAELKAKTGDIPGPDALPSLTLRAPTSPGPNCPLRP